MSRGQTTRRGRGAGRAAVALVVVLHVLALAACDAAFDGPGLRAAAVGAAADVVVPLDEGRHPELAPPPPDVTDDALGDGSAPVPDASAADVVAAEDVVPDAGEPADVVPDATALPDAVVVDVPAAPDVPGHDSGTVCPVPEGPLNAFTMLGLLSDAGLDVDGDPATCSLAPLCSGGVDNALAAVAELLGSVVEFPFGKEATLVPAFQHLTADPEAGPYPLAIWLAEAESDLEECDHGAPCSIILYGESVGPPCSPPWVLADATLRGDTLRAGHPEQHFRVGMLSATGTRTEVTVFALQVVARVGRAETGAITRMEGTLGGAIRTEDLLALVGLLPDDSPVPREAILDVVSLLLDADIDTDGDGERDALSFAVAFRATGAESLALVPDALASIWMQQD